MSEEVKKEKELPWMPVYWDKLLSATTHFNAAEVGGYILLIAYQWKHGSIPEDIRMQKKISRISSIKMLNLVRSKFLIMGDKMLNVVCQNIRNEQLQKFYKRSKANTENVKTRYESPTNRSTNRTQNNRIIDNKIISNEIIINTNELFAAKLLEDDGMLDAIGIQTRKEINPETLKKFNASLITAKKSHEKYDGGESYCEHFRNWLNKQPENKNVNTNSKTTGVSDKDQRVAGRITAGESEKYDDSVKEAKRIIYGDKDT